MELILDLKDHPELVSQYVELRNCYCELLLTHSVDIAETIQWIEKTTAEIRVIQEGNSLLGVVLLYVDRGGEVAFFAREQNRGIGTKMLQVVDIVAKQKSLQEIWAWVREDNLVAAKVFKKCGYRESGREDRLYKEQRISGIRFTKTFEENNI